MKVTVCEVDRPDREVQDWPHIPHLGLPFPGDEILLPRSTYQPKDRHCWVVRYRWDLTDNSLRMLVKFD